MEGSLRAQTENSALDPRLVVAVGVVFSQVLTERLESDK